MYILKLNLNFYFHVKMLVYLSLFIYVCFLTHTTHFFLKRKKISFFSNATAIASSCKNSIPNECIWTYGL